MLKFKLTALITGIACTLASIHIPIVSAETKPTETVHNIVVFAQFKDTDSYNFMEDRVQEIQDMCEDRSEVASAVQDAHTGERYHEDEQWDNSEIGD